MNNNTKNSGTDQQDNNARINLDNESVTTAIGAGKLKEIIEKATDLARQKNSKPVSYYTRFLSRAILLEESGPPRAIISTVGVISLFLFGAIIWAAVTTLNETSVAIGQIRPASTVQPVQHLEGGIVAKVLVNEGDVVNKGQTILKLVPTSALANLEKTKARHISLSLQIARLKAFAAGEEGNFSSYEKEHPLMVQDQKDILQQQNKSSAAQQGVILSQLDERKNELLLLGRQEKTETKNLMIITEEMQMRQELTDKGLGSKIKLLEILRAHNKAEGELIQTQSKKIIVRAKIARVKGDLVALNEKFRNESLIKVDALSSERAQVSAELTQLRDKVKRLAILSPADGVVKGLKYRSIGSVVPPGDLVAEIVPLSDILVAEVRISPRDIGHVNVGTEVLLKIDTYNYARYGSISSSLHHVSASSFLDDEGNTYFKGLVNLPHNYIGTNPKSNRITSGMTVVADIQTGKKTLLQYLVKPINNALDTSFRER
ncbi:MAG: HlyD family type I secretion periplasmic adaptor subunit [Emcibacter sp.]|nr:HlyD family type I secretion periplasmic adaptor subunit [Emcibacter sp.]